MKPITLEWVNKAEGDFATLVRESRARVRRNNDAICFHAEQCVEKYLKGKLAQAGINFSKTHDLTVLLDLVKAVEPMWEVYRADFAFLTECAVKFRYPGESAKKKTATEALAMCRAFRKAARESMGLRNGH
jgi:HEPN domain-containing protein